MKRRGCIKCHLIEPTPGLWSRGLCPRCTQMQGDSRATAEPGVEPGVSTAEAPRKVIPPPDWIERPLRHLRALPARYPRIWQQVDHLRSLRGKEGMDDWPSWCYMPMAGAYAIATQGRNDVLPSGVDVAVIAALAAWRVSQGIYRFDATLLSELWETPLDGDIPVDILERLPEWCCYVPLLEPRRILGMEMHGFFVHLEHDANTGHRELRLLLDVGPSHLTPIPLHLVGNLSECLQESMAEARRNAETHGMASIYRPDGTVEDIHADTPEDQARLVDLATRYTVEHGDEIAPLISLTLYLCSTNAEILGRDGQNKPLNRPPLRHTKRGTRMFPPPQAEVWEVGFRLGATLRAAGPRAAGPDRGGTHATPRAHLRRAHWHAFWAGPKAKPGRESTDRRLVLHWLPPVLVAATEGEAVPTVHRVIK